MKISILAADSMGVRSVATVVEACGMTIGLDLGASIAPRRYGLPPHELELKRLEESLDLARRWVRDSDIVVLTHYHYDHYLSGEPDLYRGKTLLVKDFERDINRSQKFRSYRFLKRSGLIDHTRVEVADSRSFRYGPLTLEFSKPVWHGEPGTPLGKVIMVRILCEDQSVIFTSDIQGPIDREAMDILKSWSRPKPHTVILVGPPTYFAGYKTSVEAVTEGLNNILGVIEHVRPRNLVVDHHLLRDLKYSEHLKEHYRRSRELKVRLTVAAEYMNKPVEQLEARRKELWGR